MAKNILVLVGDFTEDYEIMVPYQMLVMIGHNVDVVCPNKKKGDKIQTAVHDFSAEHQTYTEKLGHMFALNKTFDEVNPADYQGLVIPGGRGCEYIKLNPKVVEIAEYFLKNQLPIAAICHGVELLTECPSMKGRKSTCYFTVQNSLKLTGNTYIEKEVDDIVIDGNLVTGVAWPAHPKWIRAFLELLGTKISL